MLERTGILALGKFPLAYHFYDEGMGIVELCSSYRSNPDVLEINLDPFHIPKTPPEKRQRTR